MVYTFVSFSKKISSKGNVYAKMAFVDNQGNFDSGVIESIIYEPLISQFEALGVAFGDLVDVVVDLKGVVSFDVSAFKD